MLGVGEKLLHPYMLVNWDLAVHAPQNNEDLSKTLEHLIVYYIAGTILSSWHWLVHLIYYTGDRFSEFSSTKKQTGAHRGQYLPNTSQLLAGGANFRTRQHSPCIEVLWAQVKRICNEWSEERHASAHHGCHYLEQLCDGDLREMEYVVDRWREEGFIHCEESWSWRVRGSEELVGMKSLHNLLRPWWRPGQAAAKGQGEPMALL